MTYRSIVGHARVKALLSGAVSRGSIPPTLLFTGPHGVGKTLVAEATASALNCLAPVKDVDGLPLDACGTCRSCDRIARGMHVDITRVEPDDTAAIKIDVVRDVLERTGYRPFEGKRRVVIIREADALLASAQNSLLKSLEEPPPSTVFILTTAVPGALLPTVRSRCMQLRFGRLKESDVADLLTRDSNLSGKAARAAAALADGSVAQALALGSTDLAVLREVAIQLLQEAARGRDVAAKLRAAATVATAAPKKDRTREEIGIILRFVASLLRDVELLNAGGDTRALANAAVSEDLGPLARAYAGDRARDAFIVIDRALAALERNAGAKVIAEWVATQI